MQSEYFCILWKQTDRSKHCALHSLLIAIILSRTVN